MTKENIFSRKMEVLVHSLKTMGKLSCGFKVFFSSINLELRIFFSVRNRLRIFTAPGIAKGKGTCSSGCRGKGSQSIEGETSW